MPEDPPEEDTGEASRRVLDTARVMIGVDLLSAARLTLKRPVALRPRLAAGLPLSMAYLEEYSKELAECICQVAIFASETWTRCETYYIMSQELVREVWW
jgi:hypothetical protein